MSFRALNFNFFRQHNPDERSFRTLSIATLNCRN